ncbi:nucleotidyltransferase family protein [Litorivicinus sp.]|nr:nucleotidyltransferase family protein [Litorivicinus sp.]
MRAVQDYFVSPVSSMREVVEIIDRGAVQIALVMEMNRLVGIVTDGDVRRGLLRGESLDAPAANIMCRDFRSLPAKTTSAEALALMQRERLHQIPVVDESGRVVHLFLLEDLIKSKKRPNSVVIMAGGEGRRLRPLTDNCPKPMLQVAGKPLLEIILKQCLDAGFENFYFAVNYLKEQIRSHFGDGRAWGARIRYLEEGKPLGTAGALSLLPEQLSEPFLVLNGDVLSRVDYTHLLRFHADHQSKATLCVREHTTQIPYGVVRMDDLKVVALEEKPLLTHYVNAGIYLLDPVMLKLVPKDTFFDMPQLLETATQRGKLVNAFPIHEYWLDIGHPETLERAHGEWK